MATSQKLRCRVQKVTDHGDHVYTVDLAPEQSLPRFKPGQFLHLTLDDYDPGGFWPESRVFSIASSPAQRNELRISYSVRGKYTARMENELREGRILWIKMPYGEFVIQNSTDVVLLAGGTGITAFTAFLENITPDYPNQVYLAYGARNRSLLTYKVLLDDQVSRIEKLQAYYFIEHSCHQDKELQATSEKKKPASPEIPGYVDIGSFWSSIKNPYDANFYISGPPAMNRSLSNELLQRGIQKTNIIIDAWE